MLRFVSYKDYSCWVQNGLRRADRETSQKIAEAIQMEQWPWRVGRLRRTTSGFWLRFLPTLKQPTVHQSRGQHQGTKY